VAGDTLNLGVVEAVDNDLIVGTEPSKIRADRAGRSAFRTADDPPSEENDDQQDSCPDNNSELFQSDSPSRRGCKPARAAI